MTRSAKIVGLTWPPPASSATWPELAAAATMPASTVVGVIPASTTADRPDAFGVTGAEAVGAAPVDDGAELGPVRGLGRPGVSRGQSTARCRVAPCDHDDTASPQRPAADCGALGGRSDVQENVARFQATGKGVGPAHRMGGHGGHDPQGEVARGVDGAVAGIDQRSAEVAGQGKPCRLDMFDRRKGVRVHHRVVIGAAARNELRLHAGLVGHRAGEGMEVGGRSTQHPAVPAVLQGDLDGVTAMSFHQDREGRLGGARHGEHRCRHVRAGQDLTQHAASDGAVLALGLGRHQREGQEGVSGLLRGRPRGVPGGHPGRQQPGAVAGHRSNSGGIGRDTVVGECHARTHVRQE